MASSKVKVTLKVTLLAFYLTGLNVCAAPTGFQCPVGAPDQYYHDPDNCEMYYACVGPDNPVRYHMQCPSGLYFGNTGKKCTYPWLTNCKQASTPSPAITLGGAPNGPTTASAMPDPCNSNPCSMGSTCHTYYDQPGPTHSGHLAFFCICAPGYTGTYCTLFECPSLDDSNPNGLYPVSDDCSHYYQCDNDANPVLMSCPGTLVFNPVALICDWPYQAGCSQKNNCYSGACQNGGTCVDAPNSYTCE